MVNSCGDQFGKKNVCVCGAKVRLKFWTLRRTSFQNAAAESAEKELRGGEDGHRAKK